MSADAAKVIAQKAAETMWAHDGASKYLGMELLSVGPGAATVALNVLAHHTNGHGTAHGGIVFALGDTAFAFACNSEGHTTVAAHCSVTFLKPGRVGMRLVATARRISSQGRSGLYDVQIKAGEDVIAEFRGHSRTVGGSFIDQALPRQ
jgi:acyl-CoA thioesterase